MKEGRGIVLLNPADITGTLFKIIKHAPIVKTDSEDFVSNHIEFKKHVEDITPVIKNLRIKHEPMPHYRFAKLNAKILHFIYDKEKDPNNVYFYLFFNNGNETMIYSTISAQARVLLLLNCIYYKEDMQTIPSERAVKTSVKITDYTSYDKSGTKLVVHNKKAEYSEVIRAIGDVDITNEEAFSIILEDILTDASNTKLGKSLKASKLIAFYLLSDVLHSINPDCNIIYNEGEDLLVRTSKQNSYRGIKKNGPLYLAQAILRLESAGYDNLQLITKVLPSQRDIINEEYAVVIKDKDDNVIDILRELHCYSTAPIYKSDLIKEMTDETLSVNEQLEVMRYER